MIKFLSSSCKNCVLNVGKKWTLQISIPQYPVLVLKLSPIYTVLLNTVILIPHNQCSPGTPFLSNLYSDLTIFFSIKLYLDNFQTWTIQRKFHNFVRSSQSQAKSVHSHDRRRWSWIWMVQGLGCLQKNWKHANWRLETV